MSESQPTTPSNARLYAAILAAQRDIDAVTKGASNSHHNFKYAASDEVVSECRGVLHKAGLTVTRCGSTIRPGEFLDKANKNGAYKAPSAWIDVHFLIAHPESGESEVRTYAMYAEAENGQPLDKKILGAMTGAMGYFLVGLLLVPRFDENEISARDDSQYDPNAIGSDGEKWIRKELHHRQFDLEWLRQAVLRLDIAREDPKVKASIKGQPREWSRKLVVPIQGLFKQHPTARDAEPEESAAAFGSLPQDTRRVLPVNE